MIHLHKWTRWHDAKARYNHSGNVFDIQFRTCDRCGKEQRRTVYAK